MIEISKKTLLMEINDFYKIKKYYFSFTFEKDYIKE
jgi:hypothetical protein